MGFWYARSSQLSPSTVRSIQPDEVEVHQIERMVKMQAVVIVGREDLEERE